MVESAKSYYHPHQSQHHHVFYVDDVSSTNNARVAKQKHSTPSRALFGNQIEMEDGDGDGNDADVDDDDDDDDDDDGNGDTNNQEDHIGLDTVSLQTSVILPTQLQSYLRRYRFCATPYCKHGNNDCDKSSGTNISSSVSISSDPSHSELLLFSSFQTDDRLAPGLFFFARRCLTLNLRDRLSASLNAGFNTIILLTKLSCPFVKPSTFTLLHV